MSVTPANDILVRSYSKIAATAISNAYQHYAGNTFMLDGADKGVIKAVTICPYDEVNAWIFTKFYEETRDFDQALDFHKSPYFDVAFIVEDADKNIVPYKLRNAVDLSKDETFKALATTYNIR